jgi:hypothetical protein
MPRDAHAMARLAEQDLHRLAHQLIVLGDEYVWLACRQAAQLG